MKDVTERGISPGAPARERGGATPAEGSWFPWSFFLVEVSHLLGVLQLPNELFPVATKALATASTDDVDKDVDEVTSSFLKKVRDLTPSQRRSVCVLSSAGVLNCNGRALREFQEAERSGTFFRDDPEGWIKNGLWCFDEDALPLDGSQSVPVTFLPCSILEFERRPVRQDNSAEMIIPWVYVGPHSYRKEIERWRAGYWLQDVRDGYAIKGHDLRQKWLSMCPGTAHPDPVFRFLATPTSDLRREAELFMQQISDSNTSALTSQAIKPSQFEHGPWYGSQESLRKKLTGTKRQQITNRLWSRENPHGTIWKHPKSKPKSRDAEFWFLHKADFIKVRDAK